MIAKKYKGISLKGIYDGSDPNEKIITYDHIEDTDNPTPAQYKKMAAAAKEDLQKLKDKNVKVKYVSGKSGNDIGLPYILIQESIKKSELKSLIKEVINESRTN